tara:strand:+ start:178 stop:840 length:663 start_codon:yes stop_codon:yes gene_type:complete
MNLETLKKLRLLIPGIIIVIYGLFYISIISEKEFSGFEFKEYTIPTVIAIIIGVFYEMFEVRYLVTNYSHKKIDLNIKNHICRLFTQPLTDIQRQFLFNKNRLKSIFYHVVDNDESLKQKSKNIYFNGIIWTSTADLSIISIFISVFVLISMVFFEGTIKNDLLIFGFTTIMIGLISLGLHSLAFLKHIKLSNEQIDFIETHHINLVNTKITETLSQIDE